MTKRKGGGRYRRFRARILTRDVGVPSQPAPTAAPSCTTIPPWSRAATSSTPITLVEFAAPATSGSAPSLRERLGLPHTPSSKPPARPVDKAGPPRVWLGEAFADHEVDGPAQVIMHTGETRYVPQGRRG